MWCIFNQLEVRWCFILWIKHEINAGINNSNIVFHPTLSLTAIFNQLYSSSMTIYSLWKMSALTLMDS